MKSADQAESFVFLPIHLDAARNSTDDFNLFHDHNKWSRIRNNPFGGPIALGFQLECLIEERIRRWREAHGEMALIAQEGLRFSNYQFTFASVVRPGESFQVEITKSQFRRDGNATLSNRVVIRRDNTIVLIGNKRESRQPLFLADLPAPVAPSRRASGDRSRLTDQPYFLKRKYMNTGNAKNFLAGSLADQTVYFDELEDRVQFPETFPDSLISCDLLERARQLGHDFERDPLVYTAHGFSIDRVALAGLRSNDMLQLLVGDPEIIPASKGLGKSGANRHVYACFGLINEGALLFRAEIALTPLDEILAG